MSFFVSLSQTDFRTTFRDPIFKALLFFPIISFFLVRWILPFLTWRFPILSPYTQVILMWACLQSATMFGFIYGFLLLEEKEERIWEAIRVMPVSGLKLILSRTLVGWAVSSAVNYSLLEWGGAAEISLDREILLSFQFSLSAPLITLALGAFAENRIEGLAQMKMINLFLILPGLIYFFPYDFLNITAIVPTYWSFRCLELAMSGSGEFMKYFAIGSISYIVAILFLNFRLSRSVSNS